eukprot:GDKH01002066.1.p1 GENE.GDKH01002066.1~~GDKH01002066.1.p1  ORF type:complete len:88 (+),score=14.91 GDKH01002066.1:157-420(+)
MQNLVDLDGLDKKQRDRVLEKLNELQAQDTMNMYNGLVERCFGECITHFRAKDLDGREKDCIDKCVKKFMSFYQRLGLRFQEKNMGK